MELVFVAAVALVGGIWASITVLVWAVEHMEAGRGDQSPERAKQEQLWADIEPDQR